MCPSENDGDERVRLRLSRLAGCLQRLLAPHLTAAHISWMARRVLNVDDLLQGRVLLPVTGFRTEDQADVVWERLAIELDVRGVGPGNLRTDVDAIFEELALNAAQHSDTKEFCYGVVEVSQSDQTDDEVSYVIGVSDDGIGVPNSLRKNPSYAGLTSDKDAILRATEMDVSGTEQQRGAGLYHVMERVKAYRGELAIISGHGFLRVSQGRGAVVEDLSEEGEISHPGTVVLVSLSVPALEAK